MLRSDGKQLEFRGHVSILDDKVMGFSIYDDCDDKLEAAMIKANGLEEYALDVMAAGLVFNRKSSRAITEALKHIVKLLEKYNSKGTL